MESADSKNNYSDILFILVRQKWIANYLNALQWEKQNSGYSKALVIKRLLFCGKKCTSVRGNFYCFRSFKNKL